MSQAIGKRIKALRGGRTQESLAKEVGVSRVSISNWERGETKNLKGKNLINLAKAGKTTPDYILYGGSASSSSNIEAGPDIRGDVPEISWVQAGNWCEAIDNFEPGDAEHWWPCPVPHGPRTFVLRVRGPSMTSPHGPSFPDGQLIYVDPDVPAEPGKFVVMRLDDRNEVTFKRLMKEGDQLYLEALNPTWPDRYMPVNEPATACGVVIFQGQPV